jgi:hypothetical protein
MGARTIYMHPACDPEGKHQDRLMAAWEKKHPEAKGNPGRRYHLQEADRSGRVWQSYAPGSLHADPEAHAYWRGRMVAHEISARESPVENPSAAWHRKEMDESNRMSAYYHSAGMLKARDRQRGETAAHRQSAFIAPETGRSYHELEARLTREAGPRVAAPEDTQFPREYRAGYLAAHLHSAEEARGRGNPGFRVTVVKGITGYTFVVEDAAGHHWVSRRYARKQQAARIARMVSAGKRVPEGTLHRLNPSAVEGAQGNPRADWHKSEEAFYKKISKFPNTKSPAKEWFLAKAEAHHDSINALKYGINPSPVEGARLARLAGSPEASYRAFHQANIDKRSKVKVPEGWPRKLWYLGRIVEAGVSSETGGYARIMGGTLAVGPGGRKLYILKAPGALKAGVTARMEEIQYAPPKKSRKAFGGAYVHHFDNPPTVKSFGGGNYEIAGQGLKLTRRGIVG